MKLPPYITRAQVVTAIAQATERNEAYIAGLDWIDGLLQTDEPYAALREHLDTNAEAAKAYDNLLDDIHRTPPTPVPSEAQVAAQEHRILGRCFAFTMVDHLVCNHHEREQIQTIDKANLIHHTNGMGDCCASHDYMDANVTMLQAFRMAFGRDMDIQDNADMALVNKAWTWAKREGYAKIVNYIEEDKS